MELHQTFPHWGEASLLLDEGDKKSVVAYLLLSNPNYHPFLVAFLLLNLWVVIHTLFF